MILYHVSTPKKSEKYYVHNRIIQPVRGFSTLAAAKEWARRTGRTVIFEIIADNPHKLPDHHNQYGCAYWNEGDVTAFMEVRY